MISITRSRLSSPSLTLFYRLDPQIVGEREADIKHLQEQLTAANQANEAGQATQGSQNQSSQSAQASDGKAAGDVSQAQQEELAGLRQEVPALNE